MKISLAAVSFCLLVFISSNVVSTRASGGANWFAFSGCLVAKLGPFYFMNPSMNCAAGQMNKYFELMRSKDCLNCDKYFHCEANYNAVQQCGRNPDAIKTATVISDCREFSQSGADPADTAADQAANRHGRGGGSCAKYLCAANCKYSPSKGTCHRSNC